MTAHLDNPSGSGELLPAHYVEPAPLLDPQTARAVRVLCWTLSYLLWFWVAISVLGVVAFAVGVLQGAP